MSAASFSSRAITDAHADDPPQPRGTRAPPSSSARLCRLVRAPFRAARSSRGFTVEVSTASTDMTDLRGPICARTLDRARSHHRHPSTRSPGRHRGRHDEVPAALGRRPTDRVRLHSRHARPDLLHQHPGRLRDGLRLLPDRQDGPRPPPDRRRNCRTSPRARASHGLAGVTLQHRAHGNGRTPAQLRRHDEGPSDPGRRTRAWQCTRGA